jgi:hypothetical protein
MPSKHLSTVRVWSRNSDAQAARHQMKNAATNKVLVACCSKMAEDPAPVKANGTKAVRPYVRTGSTSIAPTCAHALLDCSVLMCEKKRRWCAKNYQGNIIIVSRHGKVG